jgi:DNA end-binding protein Ku
MKPRRSEREKVAVPSSAAGGHETARQGIWSGTISFSLVAIPVRLVKAVDPGRVSFHLLHRKDYSPLARRMFCPQEEKIVPPEEIVRGYEIGPDKYIPVSDEELESVSPERSRTIGIVDFIDMEEVDPVYYDHPYYLVPLKGGEKAYGLLAEVMGRTKKAGLAKFVLGEREYLVAVQSAAGALSLITLHYRDEILSTEGMVPKERGGDGEEKNRLEKTIRAMAADFAPERYVDRRREKILALLKERGTVTALVEAPEDKEEEGGTPVDLIAVLEESMRKVKENR